MRRIGWSSAVVRQAVTSTLLMLAAIALIAFGARIVTERQQRSAMIATIDTDIAGLIDGMARGGPAEVADRIADRIAFTGRDGAQYRLANAQGARIVGNLPDGVALDPLRSQSGVVATPFGPALARATRLHGGYTLTVARSLRPDRAAVDRLMTLFALASIPAALSSILAGAWSARRFGRELAGLNHVFRRFEAGDQSVRAGLNRSDELGRLSTYIDSHLARIGSLMSTQRQISENIAHELRTPLGHLDGRLLTMMSRNKDPAVEEDLHAARADIRSIVSLFDTLLDLAMAEAGDGDGANAAMFDLSEQMVGLVELYGPSAEEAGLEFTARITPAVTMRGEPMAMTRAVANLLDNAFKFTGAGSHVRLTVTQGPRIVVEDDGPGIATHLRDSVFERFRGSRASGQGHGLGLALVKVIAIRHGLVPRFEDALPGARFVLAPAAAA